MTQIASTDSLYVLYENCDPELLKRTREAVGMDEGVLARTACLSTAQVRQLESGGAGLFYSITIKRQAYKRLMMILGAEPPTHAPMSIAEDTATGQAGANPDNKDTIENIVALSSKSDYLERQPVKDFLLDIRYRVMAHRQFVGALLFLVVAVMLLVLTWRGVWDAAPPSATSDVKVVATPEVAAKPVVVSPPAAVASVAASTAAAAVVATPVTKPASEPVVAVASKPNASGPKACAYAEEKLTEVMSGSANKPPNYVYVVSPVPTTVCVVDGAKKATVLDLRANEGRSVYGPPPWQMSGGAMKDLQIFFQGVRVKAPEGHEQHFTLLEKP